MVFNVDIGNSRIKIACMNGYEILRMYSFEYNESSLNFYNCLNYVVNDLNKRNLCNNIQDIDEICICSVVPSILKDFYDACKLVFGFDPFLISYNKNIGIILDVDFPEKIGNDRICDCSYASYKFDCPCLVIDIGTAIVINIVKDKTLLGGAILPGLQTSVIALTKSAEQLSGIDISIPDNFCARNTKDSINLGVVISAAGAINSMTKNINELYKTNFKLVVTGFSSKFLLPFLDYDYVFEKNLTINGIEYIRCLNN